MDGKCPRTGTAGRQHRTLAQSNQELKDWGEVAALVPGAADEFNLVQGPPAPQVFFHCGCLGCLASWVPRVFSRAWQGLGCHSGVRRGI